METLTSGQRCLDSPGDLSVKGGIEVRGGLFDHQHAVLAGDPLQLHGRGHIGPAEIFQDDAQLVTAPLPHCCQAGFCKIQNRFLQGTGGHLPGQGLCLLVKSHGIEFDGRIPVLLDLGAGIGQLLYSGL